MFYLVMWVEEVRVGGGDLGGGFWRSFCVTEVFCRSFCVEFHSSASNGLSDLKEKHLK